MQRDGIKGVKLEDRSFLTDAAPLLFRLALMTLSLMPQQTSFHRAEYYAG
jgi:hypothetical protein